MTDDDMTPERPASYGETVCVRCLCLLTGVFWTVLVWDLTRDSPTHTFSNGLGMGITAVVVTAFTLLILLMPLRVSK